MTAPPNQPANGTPATFEEFAELADQMPAATAVIAKVDEVTAASQSIVANASTIDVVTEDDAKQAAAFLVELKRVRDSNEAERVALSGPIHKAWKAVNDRFKVTDEPLKQADGIVRGKLRAYEQQLREAAAAEQRRLDAERAEREAQAERERLEAEANARAAREAAEAEAARLAAEQEEARLAAVAAQADPQSLAARARVTDDERLAELATRDDQLGQACRDEIERRRAAAEREAAQAAAVEAARRARELEEQARTAPPPQPPAAVVAAPRGPRAVAGGSVNTKSKWEATVVDEQLVPRRFLIVDMRAINAAMHAGERDIPGVRIEQVTDIAVSAR